MKRLLVFTAWYPTIENPHQFTFVSQQVKILQRMIREGGGEMSVIVWNEMLSVDFPNRMLRGKSPNNYDWEDEEIKVKTRESTILSHRLPINQYALIHKSLSRTWKQVTSELGGVPDCVWVVTLSSAILWEQFQKRMGLSIPSFLQEHSVPLTMHLKHNWSRKLARNLDSISIGVVVAERQIAEFQKLTNITDLRIVHNTVDPRFLEFSGHKTTKRSMIFVGRLSPQKGLNRLIKALSILGEKADWRSLDIVGSGEDEGELKAIIEKYELQDKVRLLGNKNPSQISELLDKKELFVLPSFYENCPVSLLEAQVKGLVCVVTENGASEKVLLEGNGVSVSDDGSGNQLASALTTALNGIANFDRDAIRERAKERFSPSVFTREMKEVIEEII